MIYSLRLLKAAFLTKKGKNSNFQKCAFITTKELLKRRPEKQKLYAKYMTTSNPDDNIKYKRC